MTSNQSALPITPLHSHVLSVKFIQLRLDLSVVARRRELYIWPNDIYS
jgi:hypothetical protein